MLELQGKKVLVTRAKAQAEKTLNKFRELGAEPILFPLIEITKPSDNFAGLDRALKEIPSFDWLIFTSQNAVKYFFSRPYAPEPSFLKARLAAVGEETCALLRSLGCSEVEVPEEESAAGLLRHLQNFEWQGKKVFFPRAQMGQQTLVEGLEKLGAEVNLVETYQTILPNDLEPEDFAELLQAKDIDYIYFASPSQIKNFIRLCEELKLPSELWDLPILAVGPSTEREAQQYFKKIQVFSLLKS